jgi:hypothetical protein
MQRRVITDEFGPFDCDHSKCSTPLRVKEDIAHGWRDCGEGGRSGRMGEGGAAKSARALTITEL